MPVFDVSGLSLVGLIYLIVVNGISYGLFGWDKRAATRGDWRIAESTLLLTAAVGGSAGAILGQRNFRHKTQKQPFGAMLYGIAAVQGVLVLLFGL